MKKIKDFFINHKTITLLVMSFILGFLTILVSSSVSSFVYAYQPSSKYVNDQSIFYYLGAMMLKGKTPYLEVFDHKGLYLFYYSAFGLMMGGKVGFFILQTLFLTSIYFFMMKALIEFKAQKTLVFVGILLFLALYCFSMQSPSDFELQLPLITLLIYFYVLGINRNEERWFVLGNLIAGVCAGVAINCRASDALVPFAFVVGYFVRALRTKKIKELLISAGACILAIVIISIPPFIHSYLGGFTKEMYNAILFDNFRYVGAGNLGSKTVAMISRVVIIIVAVLFYLPLIINRKKLLEHEFIMVCVMSGIMFAIQLIIARYVHYIFIMTTLIFIYVVRTTSLFFDEEKKWFLPVKISALVIAVASLFTYPTIYYTTQYQKDKEIVNFICENISYEERQGGHVLCVGENAELYANCDIIIGYADFNVQFNHVNISSEYSFETLTAYYKSGDCHYVILYKGRDTSEYDYTTSWFSTAEGTEYFTKIPGKYVDIFKYSK